MTSDNEIRISEIYGPVIQGEGSVIGEPAIMLRIAGCDYRCDWCDTKYAVEPKKIDEDGAELMTVDKIIDRVHALSKSKSAPRELVTITGGNPAIYDCEKLIKKLNHFGYKTQIETQGSIYREWFREAVNLTVSPKGPSSSNDSPVVDDKDHTPIQDVIDIATKIPMDKLTLKVVCFNETDFIYAESLIERFGDIFSSPFDESNKYFYLQAGTDEDGNWRDNFVNLKSWAIKSEYSNKYKVLPQMHVAVHGEGRKI